MTVRAVPRPDDSFDEASPIGSRTLYRLDPARFDEAVSAAIEALRDDDGLYQRGGSLVRVVRDVSPDGARALSAPTLVPVSAPHLSARLARVFACAKENKHGLRVVEIPQRLVASVLDAGEWPGMRTATGVVEQPVMLADGRVLQSPGWDPASGLIYEPNGTYLPISPRPTRLEAVEAMAALLDLVVDFPFAQEHHRSAAVAAILTIFARPAILSPTPLFLFEAATPGTGKTRLIDAISLVTTGREASKRSYTTDPDEMRKVWTSQIMAGRMLTTLDNVRGNIGDPTTDMVLTTLRYEDRVLGSNTTFTATNLMVVFVSANNPGYNGDTARRTLPIRLESKLENPEERQDFKHPKLMPWVMENRTKLAHAALTVLRAWHVAGRPDMDCKAWGSFEGWSDVVPPAIVYAGMPDPMLARGDLGTAADPKKEAIATLLECWQRMDPSNYGMTVGQVLRTLFPQRGGYNADPPPDPDYFEGMRSALLELAAAKGGEKVDPRQAGVEIRRARARVIKGRMFVEAGSAHGAVRWKVVQDE